MTGDWLPVLALAGALMVLVFLVYAVVDRIVGDPWEDR